MIAPDHDWRLQLAPADHLVERQAKPMPITEPDPTDACRQALKADARTRHVQPVVQVCMVRQQFLDFGVGTENVLRITRQCGPAEWSHTTTEQRPYIRRNEA